MPLPEQLIDRLSRESAQTPGWSGKILMFSGTVFFIGFAAYIGLVFGYKPYLENQVAELDSQIKTFGQQVPPEEQNKLISFYSQTINLQNIFSRHVVSSQIFKWLEKNTRANVYYTKLSLTSSNNRLNLSGASKTIDDFAGQLLVFQNNPLVLKIAINTFISSANNLWQFDITLFLADNAFSQTAVQQ